MLEVGGGGRVMDEWRKGGADGLVHHCVTPTTALSMSPVTIERISHLEVTNLRCGMRAVGLMIESLNRTHRAPPARAGETPVEEGRQWKTKQEAVPVPLST